MSLCTLDKGSLAWQTGLVKIEVAPRPGQSRASSAGLAGCSGLLSYGLSGHGLVRLEAFDAQQYGQRGETGVIGEGARQAVSEARGAVADRR